MKKNEAQLQFDTLSIEGGLFTAEWLGKVASFKAPGQIDANYAVRAGFSTREEIAFAWRSAQHLWGQFKSARQPSGADAWEIGAGAGGSVIDGLGPVLGGGGVGVVGRASRGLPGRIGRKPGSGTGAGSAGS